MNKIKVVCLILFFTAGLNVTAEDSRPPWASEYTGIDATGENVIALWQFNMGDELKDSSGKGHNLILREFPKNNDPTGSRFVEMGKFGACLECFSTSEKKGGGVFARNSKELSPQGAFTLEMWIRPKPGFMDEKTMYLLDKKYISGSSSNKHSNCDYMLYMYKPGAKFQFVVFLGYGDSSAKYESKFHDFSVGQWYHIAFTYDGKGTGSFFLNGKVAGETIHKDRGFIAPGYRYLCIGDRISPMYGGFHGYIDQVRILKGIPEYLSQLSTAPQLIPKDKKGETDN